MYEVIKMKLPQLRVEKSQKKTGSWPVRGFRLVMGLQIGYCMYMVWNKSKKSEQERKKPIETDWDKMQSEGESLLAQKSEDQNQKRQ